MGPLPRQPKTRPEPGTDGAAPPADPVRPDPLDPSLPELPPRRLGLLRTALRLIALVLVIYGIHLFIGLVMDWTAAMAPGEATAWRVLIFGGILAAYAVLIAIPFVPGIEIGLGLVLMRGADVAWAVYFSTVAGLLLAYWIGRLVPLRWLVRILADLHLHRACALLTRIEGLSPERRLALLRRALPRRLGRHAVNWRYLLLAALINMPGSAMIGGGGGILMLAGLSGLFRPRETALTVALAVLPVPLAVWLWGPGILEQVPLPQ